ncbi:MAG: hypothetical protein WC593_05710 [Methanoregula sp.]
MQIVHERENQNPCENKQGFGECIEKKPMHPDDFEAHLTWVTAKRFHEQVLGKTFAEKPVNYWIIG